MRRMLYIQDVAKFDKAKVEALISRLVDVLSEYLDEYIPKTSSYSKHAIMGPVGKLLGILMSGKLENKDAIIGYIVNIHRNTAKSEYVSKTAIDKLDEAVNLFFELRKIVTTRMWIKTLREIDYAVFKRRFKKIVESRKERGE